jgi:hypothetical protein
MVDAAPRSPQRHAIAACALAGATAYVGVRALVDRQPVQQPPHRQQGPAPQLLPLAAAFGAAILVHLSRYSSADGR